MITITRPSTVDNENFVLFWDAIRIYQYLYITLKK